MRRLSRNQLVITLFALLAMLANFALNVVLLFGTQLCLSENGHSYVCEHPSSPRVVILDIVCCIGMPLVAVGGVVWAIMGETWRAVILVVLTLPVSLLLWTLLLP